MAKKKKENTLSYLQMPLPEGGKSYKMTKRVWNGLNYRQTIDTGMLSMEENISTEEAPYLVPAPMALPMDEYQYGMSDVKVYENPIGLFGFDDFLIAIYREGVTIYVDYITEDEGKNKVVYTGELQRAVSLRGDDDYPRSVVQFNAYDTPTDPVDGGYIKKLLIFPDRKSMDFEIDGDFEIKDLNADVEIYTNDEEPYLPSDNANKEKYYKNTYNQIVYRWVEDEDDESNSGWKISVPPGGPPIKYATVHLSRVFGVDDNRIYASGFNDYSNWTFDTVDEYNESNAWCSPSQSNTKADGVFTGITTFQNHVVCFKRDFMHEIYNTKNPFRVQDIYAEGAIDNRTIQDVDGRLIFVSEDEVKVYTGSNPRILSYNLNLSPLKYAVSGTDGRNYYLYCETKKGKQFFVYDSYVEQWSERKISSPVINFAHNENGMYAFCEEGVIYQLDTAYYPKDYEWSFETDLITNETVNIKHIKKIQMFVDIKRDSGIKVYFLYDDETFDATKAHLVYDGVGAEGRKAIRVKPRQTAHYGFKVHIEGCGYVRLYEMEIEVQAGGDMYV